MVETKNLDTNLNDATVSSSGTIFSSLNLIDQGDGASQRIGRKICVKGLELRSFLRTIPGTITTNSLLTRLIIYVDKQCNGTAPDPDDILTGAATLPLMSYDFLPNEKRFIILSDEFKVLNQMNADDQAGCFYDVSFPLDFKIYYSGDTTSVADVSSYNIGLLVLSSVDQGLVYSGHSRLYYTDL